MGGLFANISPKVLRYGPHTCRVRGMEQHEHTHQAKTDPNVKVRLVHLSHRKALVEGPLGFVHHVDPGTFRELYEPVA